MIHFTLSDEENYSNLVEEDWGIVDVRCYGGSPVEINGTRWNLMPELEDWLESDAIGAYDYEIESSVLSFREENDAMLFKLTWL